MIPGAFDIAGKIAIVTGGGTGIGEGIAYEFAKAGCDLVIASRSKEHLEPVAAKVEKEYKRRCLAVPADVRKQEDLENLVNITVKTFGKVDILVNNQGASFTADTEKLSLNGWNTIVAINLTGSFMLSKLVYPHMKKQGKGSIIMISSTAGVHGSPKMPHYGAAKAGLINLTMSLAVEWAKDGIRVNCISPGPIITQGIVDVFGLKTKENAYKTWGTANSLGHAGWPEDIAWPSLFLASDASRFITGVNLQVDGGPRRGAETAAS
ncbi:MAG: glucose 1-dehydrogenase [Dehalococcoidia bacterium]|nr:glucose 1-dehydrogenase [Dehalococcoidia bacterium]